jgi:phosphoesterase RecJ-like protein
VSIAEAEWQRAVDLLRQVRESGTVVVAAHINPDGDALGSLAAMHAGLTAGAWKSIPTWGNTSFRVPPDLELIPGLDDVVPPPDVPDDPSLLITVDVATEDRLGMLRHLADGRCPVLVLDHHVSNTGFGDVELVDPAAAGTVVVAAQLLDRLGVELTNEMRAALHVGLLTDTGGLLHSNTDEVALRLAADFVAAGVDHSGLATELLWSRITREDLAATGTTWDVLEGIIDVLRSAREAKVTMLATEHGGGRWSVSLRSDGPVNVSDIAANWNGGGHARAAGLTTGDGPAEVARQVAALLAG